MNTVVPMPGPRAALATPWAWLPALAAATPMALRSLGRDRRTYAPRTLKVPATCRFSHVSQTDPPTRSAEEGA